MIEVHLRQTSIPGLADVYDADGNLVLADATVGQVRSQVANGEWRVHHASAIPWAFAAALQPALAISVNGSRAAHGLAAEALEQQAEVLCANPRHPNGAWHAVAPIPMQFIWCEPDTWRREHRLARRRYRRNTEAWGCGCNVVGSTTEGTNGWR